MHTSLVTVGIAFGSWAGSAAIDASYGLRSPLWIGTALAVTGLLSVAPSVVRQAQQSVTTA